MSKHLEYPLVSIITACKNSVRFIENCVQSVLEQDYPDIEYIVQDCVSSDGTVEVLRKYSSKIKLFSEPDSGIGDALDKALRKVTGDIIGIILPDERYHPGAIRWAVEGFKKYPDVAVIYGDYRSVDDSYEEISINRCGTMSFEEIFCVERVVPCPAAFIQTRHFREVGLHSDPHMSTCPDFEMWVRIGLRYRIQYTPGLVVDNMVYAGSSTCQASCYPRFVKLKRYVILRTIDDPNTPTEIKKLKARALGGLYDWAANSVTSEDRLQAVRWLTLALLAQPRGWRLSKLLRTLLLLIPDTIGYSRAGQHVQINVRIPNFLFLLLRGLKKRRLYGDYVDAKPHSRQANLLGDREIEWSWVAPQMPSGPGEALDLGSRGNPLALIAAHRGFNVTPVDLEPVRWPYVHPWLRFSKVDIFKLPLPKEHFDLVINCSTVEQVGLARRYSVGENCPDGDLELMNRLRELMKPGGVMLLTIPVGQDTVFVPPCRVYGAQRLPALLEGYAVEKEAFWVKDSHNQWVLCNKETALNFKASAGSWNPLQTVYALGCLVLRRPERKR